MQARPKRSNEGAGIKGVTSSTHRRKFSKLFFFKCFFVRYYLSVSFVAGCVL